MLKIAHTSDWHLGYRSGKKVNEDGVNLREEDGYRAFVTMIDDIILNEPDVMVMAGDIFHSPTPSIRSIVVAQEQLRKLAKAGIACYLLAGNHDVSDVRADIAASKVVDDQDRQIFSYIDPYVMREIEDGVFLHLISHHAYSEQSNTMKNVSPVEGGVNLLSTHGSVLNPETEKFYHVEASPREIIVPEYIASNPEWNGLLLGHVHERGWVGKEENSHTLYNGSLVRRGFSDGEGTMGRGWTMWTIQSDGSFTTEIHSVAQRPQYDFDEIDARGKSATEITDLIVDRLKTTQIDGNVYHPETAPILRQKIINVDPSKKEGMDLHRISQESVHAFSWDLKVSWAPLSTSSKDTEDAHTAIAKNSDIVNVFEDWVQDGSSQLKSLDQGLRAKVEKDSKEFIELGQNKILEEE